MGPSANGTSTSYALGNFCIDEPRPIKVVVIGAGYSGVIAAIRFLQRVQNIDFVLYDSNAGVGGTWFANNYPGLACDIPSHAYQPSFENKTDWSSFYASGPEIQRSIEGIVDKYGLRPFIKLQHRISCARYDEATGKWRLTVKRAKQGPSSSEGAQRKLKKESYDDWEEFQDSADILFAGVGGLSRWVWPDIPGLETFSGQVLHSAQWNRDSEKTWQDTVEEWNDKKVGVIGVGSSAIQIVTALQPRVKHLVNYVRGKTWISSTFVQDRLFELSGGEFVENYNFTDKDKERYRDLDSWRKFRYDLEKDMNHAYHATLLGNPLVEFAKTEFQANMERKLSKKPWISEHMIPEFAVACRRLTPGPGYLEALCEDNVEFVPTLIKAITPTGIETVDDKLQELDVIVCATGFDVSFQLDFPVIGRGGMTLKEHHSPNPRTYLSVAVDGFPNMFLALGANSGVASGNLLLLSERQADYAVAATLKMQRERLKSIEVKAEAVQDFEEYIDSYFPMTVFGTKCRSWYKGGKEDGRVVGLWPGSSMHAARALEHPRWEDYHYELLDGVRNRLHWLGDGNTVADVNPEVDSAWYLRPENIDYPPVPVRPA